MVAFLYSKVITEKKVFLLTKSFVVRSSPIIYHINFTLKEGTLYKTRMHYFTLPNFIL
jgi:hypothetical protein